MSQTNQSLVLSRQEAALRVVRMAVDLLWWFGKFWLGQLSHLETGHKWPETFSLPGIFGSFHKFAAALKCFEMPGGSTWQQNSPGIHLSSSELREALAKNGGGGHWFSTNRCSTTISCLFAYLQEQIQFYGLFILYICPILATRWSNLPKRKLFWNGF